MLILLFLLISLLLTLAFEGIVAAIFRVRRLGWAVFACANLLTNPIVVLISIFLMAAFPEIPAPLLQLPLEIAATVTEALIFRSFSDQKNFILPHPVAFAITANVVSWGIGIIISTLYM